VSSSFAQLLVQAYPMQNYSELNVFQVDDQTDEDDIEEFCNIWVKIKSPFTPQFELELVGIKPITPQIRDLIEIYNGTINERYHQLTVSLHVKQVAMLEDLADVISILKPTHSPLRTSTFYEIRDRTAYSLHKFSTITSQWCKDNKKPVKPSKLTLLSGVFYKR